MQMDIGLDTGDMLIKTHCDISPEDTGGSLHDKLQAQGGPALIEALTQIEQQTLQPQTQDDSLANYASKLTKQEAAIDWSLAATQLNDQIRAFIPFPVAYFSLGKDRVRVWEAAIVNQDHNCEPGSIISADNDGIVVACGDQCLRLSQLQLPGKKALPVKDILNGHGDKFQPGSQL